MKTVDVSHPEVDPDDNRDPIPEATIAGIISDAYSLSNFVLEPWTPLLNPSEGAVGSRRFQRAQCLSIDGAESALHSKKEELYYRQLLDTDQLTTVCLSRLEQIFPKTVLSNHPEYNQVKAARDVIGVAYQPGSWPRFLRLFAADMAMRRAQQGSPFESSSAGSSSSSSSS